MWMGWAFVVVVEFLFAGHSEWNFKENSVFVLSWLKYSSMMMRMMLCWSQSRESQTFPKQHFTNWLIFFKVLSICLRFIIMCLNNITKGGGEEIVNKSRVDEKSRK